MMNLEIKFSVFEVLKLLLFIFLKDQSIVRDQENIVKNCRVLMFIKRLSKLSRHSAVNKDTIDNQDSNTMVYISYMDIEQ